jgi:CDP-diacylglycerol--glycerol-3-phosphate 3-phosphatidyltransferase
MLDGRARGPVERLLAPIGKTLQRAGVSADALTVIGLVFSCVTGLLIASGHFVFATIGVAATGIPDLLDGSVARESGKAGPRGAFFDSVCDRLSDLVLMGGVAWYLTGTAHPRNAMLALGVAGFSFVISYERSKAEGLGFHAKGGLMERAERMIALGVGLLFNILVPVLWIMLVGTALTVVTRFFTVWRQATDDAATRQDASPSDVTPDDVTPDDVDLTDATATASTASGSGSPVGASAAGHFTDTARPRTFSEWWQSRRPDGDARRSRERRAERRRVARHSRP